MQNRVARLAGARRRRRPRRVQQAVRLDVRVITAACGQYEQSSDSLRLDREQDADLHARGVVMAAVDLGGAHDQVEDGPVDRRDVRDRHDGARGDGRHRGQVP
ncbi:MAG: hypothetical protein WKF75_02345 [Singulisphaera sp.]